ncbi:alpha/beta hydrolase [Bdellovibrio sp. HCB337]|uniref:alpha/beta hydrolase n=1 Tax=Bdellovibrio sp. HCB337 TaxID=3394358 RepID=UPI0039A5B2C4
MAQNQYKISEGRFKGADGASLFFQVWEKPNPRGTIIITHGHGEHTGSYHRVVDALKDENWTIYTWDMRGHGHSEGARGYAPSFDAYCDDYALFLKMVMENTKVKNGPVVLLSHSMGGLVQFKTLMKHPEFKPSALVASSPLFGIGVHVPAFKKVGAQWLNKLVPTLTLWNEITNEHVTRDPDVIRELEQDPYRHARISAGVYLGFMDSFPFIQERASQIKFKTLFQISDKDPVISSAEAIKVFENLGSTEKEIKIYPDARHEVYNDIVREQVYQDLRTFLAGVEK